MSETVCTLRSVSIFCTTGRPCCNKVPILSAVRVVRSLCPICSNSGCFCWSVSETVKCPLLAIEDVCDSSLSLCVAIKTVPAGDKKIQIIIHTTQKLVKTATFSNNAEKKQVHTHVASYDWY